MRALLRKDIYQFWDIYKWYLFVLVVICSMPGGKMASFGTLFTALLIPMSMMTLDEQSKWESLALMLPYSRTVIVLEKYVMSLLCVAVPLAICAVSQPLMALAGVKGAGLNETAVFTIFPALGLLIEAVTMPINFRFGTTKGRVFNASIVAVIIMIGLTADIMTSNDRGPELASLFSFFARVPAAFYPLAAAALCAASVPLSIHGYTVRCGR